MHTSSIVALSGVTRTLNLEVCTVSREDSRWKADSTSDKWERQKNCQVTVTLAHTLTHTHTHSPYTQLHNVHAHISTYQCPLWLPIQAAPRQHWWIWWCGMLAHCLLTDHLHLDRVLLQWCRILRALIPAHEWIDQDLERRGRKEKQREGEREGGRKGGREGGRKGRKGREGKEGGGGKGGREGGREGGR